MLKPRLNHAKNFPSGPFDCFLGFRIREQSAGESDRALKAEMITETAIVMANCIFIRPWMPPMKATGMNTADSTSAMPMTGCVTSSIAFNVASRGERPCSMWCSTASTTTIASSTTSPIARTRPKRESVLIENPSDGKNMNVPTSETGTASSGMSVARHPWRNRNTTMMTRTMASKSVCSISLMPSVIGSVVSRETT